MRTLTFSSILLLLPLMAATAATPDLECKTAEANAVIDSKAGPAGAVA